MIGLKIVPLTRKPGKKNYFSMTSNKISQIKVIPLGGVSRVNRNMFVYEAGSDIIVIDCGVDFPEAEQLGVDVILPDTTYLLDKTDRIKGIFITHGHYDHYGALPYLIEDLKFPTIYASKLVKGLIEVKLKEYNLLNKVEIKEFGSGDSLTAGCFELLPYRVNHSVPDSYHFFIRSPVGNLVHGMDFKFDWTPVDGRLFEVGRLAEFAQDGVQCLLSDCLGATSQGYTKSERFIQETFESEIRKAPGQVFITTVSSNISRIQQAYNAAKKFNRKVSFLGMSISQNVEVARNLGYLDIPDGAVIDSRKINSHPGNKLVTLIAGSYGQPESSLGRLADDRHPRVKLKKNDVVVFSADPIPGVYDQVASVIDKLVKLGGRVVYSEIQENLHVSGHGSRGDLAMLAGIVQPEYFVPIGGGAHHMRAYTNLITEMGFDREKVLELREGEGLVVDHQKVQKKEMVSLNDVFVDGSRVGDVGTVVLRDRQILSEGGIFLVILQKGREGRFKKSVEVVSRGFTYMAISDKLVDEVKNLVRQATKGRQVSDWRKVRREVENKVDKFLYRKTERSPMVMAILVD